MSEHRFRHFIGPALFEAVFVVLAVVLAANIFIYREQQLLETYNTLLSGIFSEHRISTHESGS